MTSPEHVVNVVMITAKGNYKNKYGWLSNFEDVFWNNVLRYGEKLPEEIPLPSPNAVNIVFSFFHKGAYTFYYCEDMKDAEYLMHLEKLQDWTEGLCNLTMALVCGLTKKKLKLIKKKSIIDQMRDEQKPKRAVKKNLPATPVLVHTSSGSSSDDGSDQNEQKIGEERKEDSCSPPPPKKQKEDISAKPKKVHKEKGGCKKSPEPMKPEAKKSKEKKRSQKKGLSTDEVGF